MRHLHQLLDKLPTQCLLCQRWPADAAVCAACLKQHMGLQNNKPRCRFCAIALPQTAPDAPVLTLCGACAHSKPPLDACLAKMDYSKPWNALIARWKFHQQPALDGLFASWLLQDEGAMQALRLADMLLPIPPALPRLRERGYHHTLLLAQALVLRSQTAIAIETSALARLPQKDEAAQAKRKRQARIAYMKNAFVVLPEQMGRVQGKRVMLLDDVMTTGATLYSAAQALKTAGAREVSALVLARTPLLSP